MKRSNVLVAALAVGVFVGAGASRAYGAAAVAAGAKTSAKPTAADPAKRQIQIAADPEGITDFQFTLHYDPQLLFIPTVQGLPQIRAINGYVLGVRNNLEASAYAIDQANGLVSVRGYFPTNSTVPFSADEVDVYDVVFQLKTNLFGTPIAANTPFIIYSVGMSAEFNPFGTDDTMLSGDIVNGVVIPNRVFTAGNPGSPILQADTGAITLFSVPEPAALTGLLPVAALLRRRRR